MAFSGSSQASSAVINVTPLIDILLVLLIIFMVIVPTTSRGLETVVPKRTARSAESAADPVYVYVRGSGIGNAPYTLDGQPVSRAELWDRLRVAHARTAGSSVLIGGDPTLDYRAVVAVVDEARLAGFGVIGLLPRASGISVLRSRIAKAD